jgi:hypothetical protein
MSQVRFYSDDAAMTFVRREFPEYFEAYLHLPKDVERADFFRWVGHILPTRTCDMQYQNPNRPDLHDAALSCVGCTHSVLVVCLQHLDLSVTQWPSDVSSCGMQVHGGAAVGRRIRRC